MRYLRFLLLTLSGFCFIITNSCSEFCREGSGPVKSEDREPGSFTGISLGIPANLVFEQGPVTKFRIEAQENLLEIIKTNIKKETLEIESEDCIGLNSGINIYIQSPGVSKLVIKGSGSIESRGVINTGHLQLALKGSGDIRLEAQVESVYCGISGSGNIIIRGAAQKQHVKIMGSGSYQAAELASVAADMEIDGSGAAEVFVIEKLSAHINGSGDIRYRGNPKVNTSINGSGQIERIEKAVTDTVK